MNAGRLWKSNKLLPIVSVLPMRTKTHTTFTINPAVTVSMTLTYPYENTIALGGEAAGSMKANEAASAEGNIRYRGFKFKPMARLDRMGIMRLLTAGLLINSVSPDIIRHSTRFKTHGSR